MVSDGPPESHRRRRSGRHRRASLGSTLRGNGPAGRRIIALGAIGLIALAFVVVRWAAYVRGLMGRAPRDTRAALIALAVISAIIFFGSQTEGRFLEDPYLWFAAGLAVAVEAMLRDGSAPAQRPAP